MSIKIQCRLRLPYIIRLKEAKDYTKEFTFPEFSFFKITFLFNDEEYEDIYEDDYNAESCLFVQLEIVSEDYNYQDYTVETIKRSVSGVVGYFENTVDDVPEEVEEALMQAIAPRFNEIIDFIREKSGMFWLQHIPINPDSKMIGIRTDYFFYAPNAIVPREMKYVITTIDNYMEPGSKVGRGKIYDTIFNDYETREENQYIVSDQFLAKAKTALRESKLYDSIIFAAVAQESFISKYIEDNAKESDIVYKKLTSLNGQLMELKYNVILKYIKGKSLPEINQSYYDTIRGIYQLRNAIMHSGVITEENIGATPFSKVDFSLIEKALRTIEKAFAEIKKL